MKTKSEKKKRLQREAAVRFKPSVSGDSMAVIVGSPTRPQTTGTADPNATVCSTPRRQLPPVAAYQYGLPVLHHESHGHPYLPDRRIGHLGNSTKGRNSSSAFLIYLVLEELGLLISLFVSSLPSLKRSIIRAILLLF